MENKKYTEMYEELPLIAKVLIQIIVGGLVSCIYRILRYTETKQNATLVMAILALIPPISFVPWIVDIVTEVTKNRITFFAD